MVVVSHEKRREAKLGWHVWGGGVVVVVEYVTHRKPFLKSSWMEALQFHPCLFHIESKAPCIYFFSDKEEKIGRSKESICQKRQNPSYQSAGELGRGSVCCRLQSSKVPFLYSDIINAMGKGHFTSLPPYISCAVKETSGRLPPALHTTLIVYLVTANLWDLWLFQPIWNDSC